MITVSGLTVHYHDAPVLWDIDFKVPKGNFVGILGPNGAGKSTLLKAILGLIPTVSGSVWVDGLPLDLHEKGLPMCPKERQSIGIFRSLCVSACSWGQYRALAFFHLFQKKSMRGAPQCLEKVGIDRIGDRQISQLSGGQQQRTFLARALMQEAEVYLLDEPLAGVDHTTEEIVVCLLKELVRQGKTVLMVHHDLSRVEDYFSWVLLLNVRLVALGPTKTTFTKALVQKAYAKDFALLMKPISFQKKLPQGCNDQLFYRSSA